MSRHLEIAGEPCSRSQIEQAVKGKTDYKRIAIETLIREGYAIEFSGERGARLVKLKRTYREVDEWAE
ncbi:MAG: hypothetical protein ACXVZ2_04125 [Gaiellaceae bacterium]